MPEGFHPAPPEAMHGVRREDVPADVRDYADNLMLQLDEIVARYGIPDFRAARALPDAERHERLEAVMDLGDLDRYVELIKKYRTALTKKMIPTGDREWRNVESAKPFAYDKEKARELGFAELRVEAHPKAQELMDAIYNRDPRFADEASIRAYWKANCSELPNAPGSSMEFLRALAEHRLSDSIDRDKPSNVGNPSRPHVPRFGKPEFVLVMDWKEFDYNIFSERDAAMTPETKALTQRLFGAENVTYLYRNTINKKLFADHDKRVPTAIAREVIRDLIGPGQDPGKYELRLIRYDEYARVAASQGYGGKRITTHLDGYCAEPGKGRRMGLLGGHSENGGAGYVGPRPRDERSYGIAVRLVLSRKA